MKRIHLVAVFLLSALVVPGVAAQTSASAGQEPGAAKSAAVPAAEPQAGGQPLAAPPQVVPALPVPRLIKFSGVAKDASGAPRTGSLGLTFSIYQEQEGGATLWMETQNVELDGEGHYSVLLGSTQSEGVPLDLFASGDPRWLGVKVELPGEGEQARILLVSVPYALKASDADTLGGKPASAYALAPTEASATTATTSATSTTASTTSTTTTKGKKPASAGTETMGYIPMFIDTSGDLGNSVIQQVGSEIGIGEAPAQTLDVNGGIRGTGLATGIRNTSPDAINTNALFLNGSNAMGVIGTSNAVFAPGVLFTKVSFYAGNGTVTSERMTINGANGFVGINNTSPGQQLDVKGGSIQTDTQLISTAATGTAPLSVASTTMVPNLNAGLLGGVAASGFAQLGAMSNTFMGSISASGFAGSGAGLTALDPANLSAGTAGINITGNADTATTAGNALMLGGMPPSAFLQTGATSTTITGQTTFTAAPTGTGAGQGSLYINPASASSGQTLFGAAVGGTPEMVLDSGGDLTLGGQLNLPLTAASGGEPTAGVITLGGDSFAHAYGVNGIASANTFVGIGSGNFSMTGTNNTAMGANALASNTTGSNNVAIGGPASSGSTGGAANRSGGTPAQAVGLGALASNTSGTYNVAVGDEALRENTIGNANSAFGHRALQENTTGGGNSALGEVALSLNTTGTNNTAVGILAGQTSDESEITVDSDTFLGAGAAVATGTDSNATAVGAFSVVGCSNCLVLGAVNGVNGGNSVNVGIGTTTPAATLDVEGNGNGTGSTTLLVGGPATINGNLTVAGSVTCGSGCSGGGGVTSVTGTNGIISTPSTGNVTLSLDTSYTNALYAQLGAMNIFNGPQAVNTTTGMLCQE